MKILERKLNKRTYNKRKFLTCKGVIEILLTVSIHLDWFAKTCCSSYHQLEQLLHEARNRPEFQSQVVILKINRSRMAIGLIVKKTELNSYA